MDNFLSKLSGRVRPLVLQVGASNQITGTLECGATGTPWRLNPVCVAVPDRMDALDVEFTWTLEKCVATG